MINKMKNLFSFKIIRFFKMGTPPGSPHFLFYVKSFKLP